jgi:hypothetical protein
LAPDVFPLLVMGSDSTLCRGPAQGMPSGLSSLELRWTESSAWQQLA